MAREESLLDRIASVGSTARSRQDASAAENVELLMDSVRRNLVRLLNSRHGMCESLPDYGMPSLVDITTTSADYVQVVVDAIRTCIEKYEPRLKRVRIVPTAEDGDRKTTGPQKLACRIEATLIGRAGEHRVWYETSFDGEGRCGVYG